MDPKERTKILEPYGCAAVGATCPHAVYHGERLDPVAALSAPKGRTFCGAFYDKEGKPLAMYNLSYKDQIHPAIREIFDLEVKAQIAGSSAPMTEKERLAAELAKLKADNAAAAAAEADRAEGDAIRLQIQEEKARRPGAGGSLPYGARA